jgi:iron(III) transport system ATP-binding protein
LSALDARVRINLRRQIRDLHDRLGLTTIMVTHDQEEALTMADRIVVMNTGRIEQTGVPQDIYARPASLFVADFVGAMNTFQAKVTGHHSVRLGTQDLACPGLGATDCNTGVELDATVTICWRPEDVVVITPGAVAVPNMVRTQVEAVEFLGPYHRAILRAIEFDATFTADFSANLARELGVASGHDLLVGLPAACLHVFPKRPS